MYQIDYNSYRSVKSFNRRIRFLVMHYTSLDFKASIMALTGERVSAHYLIPDPSEQTYIEAGFKDMRIFNLVDENERAWHAGVSSWAGRSNLNDTSLGIEIVNLATGHSDSLEEICAEAALKDMRVLNPVHEGGGSLQTDVGSLADGSNVSGFAFPLETVNVVTYSDEAFTFPPYNPTQIDAVKELALNILQRYPDITPTDVVGHSDIALGRKSDPGAAFPWKELYAAGIGAWYDDEVKDHYQEQFCKSFPLKADVLAKLRCYGYDISAACSEIGYKDLIRAFQLHFRQESYDGILDVETAAIIYALVDKYFPSNAFNVT
ncbi:N-acetylmuramoyl-L-alanine amidase [Bartonella henselae]|uniref:N-acetylmuramoyl-L-alanine amidase n=1 Tax=Bartonella henselae TaxID=38323 RepID=UPI000959B622|nr:N-acetylmuramoyl-L-alanine amidase [Bartonella henselae]OLL54939.1 N-acetylmuramoyl-L-alanine amidase [Bartonella henselae]OLL56417.1 N-acetylmuramoyl-L-alanine amidase [Bartonella henselae]UJM33459.1 N-acetylmuramoyl-L-alanine amidase [Bartonella henselae]